MKPDCAPSSQQEITNADYRTLQAYARAMALPSGGGANTLRIRVRRAYEESMLP